MAEQPHDSPVLSPERVAYWFFRLNGCFQIENFALHPDADAERNQMRTDADMLGVRFPFRDELGMKDDLLFADQLGRTLAFVAEIKQGGKCRLNGPWSNPNKGNLPRVLSAMGCFPPQQVSDAAKALYENEMYEDERVLFRMVAVAAERNEVYTKQKPNVLQVTWEEVFTFIHRRFRTYRYQKKDHGQWDRSGHELWKLSETQQPAKFVQKALAEFPTD
jgi:hypothetical protein